MVENPESSPRSLRSMTGESEHQEMPFSTVQSTNRVMSTELWRVIVFGHHIICMFVLCG